MDSHSLAPVQGPIWLERILGYLAAALLAGFSIASLAYTGLKLYRGSLGQLLWLLLFLAVAAGSSLWLGRRLQKAPARLSGLVLLGVALLPRLLLFSIARCAPVSDFANYFQLARWLHQGQTDQVYQLVSHYQISEFAGLAVLNYLLSLVFTPTLAGMQLSSVVLSSLICLVIYQLGAEYRKDCGIYAALIYAWYPGSIVAAQQLTNQHGAVLLALLALLLLLKGLRETSLPRLCIRGIGCAGLLVLSHFFHPSAMITLLAIVCFSVGLFWQWRNNRKALRRLGALLCSLLLALPLLQQGSLALLRRNGLLPQDSFPGTALSKIVVGLNPDTKGAYSLEDYTAIKAQPLEKQNAYCVSLIGERLRHPLALFKTLASKTFAMWIRTDNLFVFYQEGLSHLAGEGKTAQWLAHALQLCDAALMACLYAGAAAGLWHMQRKRKNSLLLRLLLWAFWGWAGVHLLSEVQPRYRYYAMPILCLFFSLGAQWALAQLQARRSKRIASPERRAKNG